MELLPLPLVGNFKGHELDYNEDYYQEVKNTIEILENILLLHKKYDFVFKYYVWN